MLEISQYQPLQHFATRQIEAQFPATDCSGSWAKFIDLTFATKKMFTSFKEFCKANGIQTRRLANAKDKWDDDRYPDDRPFAKRLRVTRDGLINWLESNTDYHQTTSQTDFDYLQQALNLLMLATLAETTYSLYSDEALPHTPDEFVLIYQVGDQPINVSFRLGPNAHGPKLSNDSLGDYHVTNLKSTEYDTLEEVTNIINNLNLDKQYVESLVKQAGSTEPKISNAHRQSLTSKVATN